MLESMQHILMSVLAPVLVIVAIGAVVQRWRRMNVKTLVQLNLYLFVPAFLYVRISQSTLSWTHIGGAALTVFGTIAVMALPIYYTLRTRRAAGNTIAAVVVGGLFFNAGNFGIPVAELAFGKPGGEVQALVVLFMNTSIFLLGYVALALAQGHGAKAALGYFKLPMIYAITAAFAVRETGYAPPAWVTTALQTIAGGMVPVALVTLGAQLVTRARWPRWKLIVPVMSLKLLIMPAVTAAIVWALGLWPWPGAQLILASAGPTAINTLLLTIELDGDAETAADCVFWTTLFCGITVTVVLSVLLALGGGPV
ncbi:AEC family transporter [Planctomycetales bacterium ZRK34]|nr:AEC family transporter [Planctomycetales bacterium ZRK34]